MKVTPIEIRQKSFEKVFRGYDKDEVDAFLLSLSQEWERMMDEQKEYRYKFELAEKEVIKLREVENSLFKTLKTAEDTGANLVEQANRTAELHVREAQMKADALLFDAKTKAKNIIDDAELKARQILEGLEDEVKGLEQHYKNLENHRDNLITDLRNLANDTLEKAEKAAGKHKSGIHTHREKARDASAEHYISKRNRNMEEEKEAEPVKDEYPEHLKYEEPQEAEEKKSGSFFDDIK